MTSDLSPIWFFTTDTQLHIVTWDEYLSRITGLTPEMAQGRSLITLFPDLETRGLVSRFQEVLSAGVVVVLSPILHHYLIACSPLQNSTQFDKMQQRVTIAPLRCGESITGCMVTIEDVTRRLEQDHELALHAAVEDSKALSSSPQVLRNLIQSLDDQNWRIRQAAIQSLARCQDPELTNILIQLFRQNYRNLNILNSVLQVLSQTQIDVTPFLLNCIADADADLRIYITKALGEQSNPTALPALLEALQDSDMNVRYQAIESLGQYKALEAVEPLMATIETDDFFLAMPALTALTQIKDATVAPRLLPLLEHESLAEAAAETLGALGNAIAIPPLVQSLTRDYVPLTTLVNALAALYSHYETEYEEGSYIASRVQAAITPAATERLLNSFADIPDGDRPNWVRVLSWLPGREVTRTLVTCLAQPEVRAIATAGLIQHGTDAVEELLAQLTLADLETQQVMVELLGELRDARAIPALIEQMMQHLQSNASLTVEIAGALAKIGDLQAFEALLQLLSHRDAIVRQAGIAALVMLGHPALEERVAALLQESNPQQRESAVRLAGYFAFPDCQQSVLACCQDTNETVRMAAIEVLPYLDQLDPLPHLIQALRTESPKIRAAAARSLGHAEGATGIPSLLNALQDKDIWVRYYAARSLGAHGYADAVNALTALARRDPELPVRVAAVEALGHIGNTSAVIVLSRLSEEPDTPHELMLFILTALGQTNHPDVLPMLGEALRSPDLSTRLAAFDALSHGSGASSISLLQWIAASANEEQVTQAAIATLAKLSTHDAIAALTELTLETKCREAVIRALGRLQPDWIDAIAAGLKHPHPEVRRAVIRALAHQKHPRASDWIGQALTDENPGVRLTAVIVLMQLGNRSAVSQLTQVVHTDPDPKVRHAAEQALVN